MDLQRTGPGGETGHDVELAEQSRHHFVGVRFAREMFEVGHHALEGAFKTPQMACSEKYSRCSWRHW